MKSIMAGSADGGAKCGATCDGGCTFTSGDKGNCHKPSSGPNEGKCFCVAIMI